MILDTTGNGLLGIAMSRRRFVALPASPARAPPQALAQAAAEEKA